MPAPPRADALRRARNGIGLGRHRRKTTAAREVVRWINEELSCSSTKIRIYRQGLKCGLSFACISREVFTITGQKAPIFPHAGLCARKSGELSGKSPRLFRKTRALSPKSSLVFLTCGDFVHHNASGGKQELRKTSEETKPHNQNHRFHRKKWGKGNTPTAYFVT